LVLERYLIFTDVPKKDWGYPKRVEAHNLLGLKKLICYQGHFHEQIKARAIFASL
jgi:hypothetical protein